MTSNSGHSDRSYLLKLGPRLLIAPVGELGVVTKDVYLPILSDDAISQGFSWTHW